MLAEGEMETEPERKRESSTILRDASVVKNYKKAMKQKKSLRKQSAPRFSSSSLAGALVVIMVALYGFRSVQQFRQEQSTPVFEQQETDIEANALQKDDQSAEEASETTTESGMTIDTSQNVVDTSETDQQNQETFSSKTTESVQADSAEQELENDVDVFTQEEPDDAEETWSYIGGQYTVKQGDTLAGISKKIYQSYDYISLLAEANQIENVDQIYPGQVLNIPPIED